MPKPKVLPHATLCRGLAVGRRRRLGREREREGSAGSERRAERPGVQVILHMVQAALALARQVEVAEPRVGRLGLCTTCHVVVREGYNALEPAEEKEEDLLDKAWGLEATSRLSCQAKLTNADLTIEIPKYTINYEREGGGKK